MNNVVLDASAVLALIGGERGHESLSETVLENAVCSTVNLSEVQAKLVSRGWTPDEAWEDATGPIREAIPFSDQHAKVAGSLITLTQPLGLSLGDRSCLALGILLRAPIYTAEKSWTKLKINVPIHVIR